MSPTHTTTDIAEARALDMATAPKDGTMLRLLVDYTDGGAPLEDEHPHAWTIGFNSLDDTGEDKWKFAGWCWTHDHFTQGSGTPVGWLPWSNPSREVFPTRIGRLSLGERLSDGQDRQCAGGCEQQIPAGHAVYWPDRAGEYPDDIDPSCISCAIAQAESDQGWCECHRLATAEAASGAGEREWPDIGEDPMKARPYDDRMAVSADALRKAYTVQQPIVPDQTALVWRSHLGALLEAEIRLRSILADDEPAVRPSAMVSPADWVNSIAGVKLTDQFIALDRRLFEDCIVRALAAAPTIPATQSDGWTDAGRAWLTAGAPIIPEGMKPWNGRYGPPQDVDHTKPAMRRDGQMTPTPITGNQWLHVPSHAGADIVAYTPKATSA